MIPNGTDSPSLVLEGIRCYDLLDPDRTEIHFTFSPNTAKEWDQN